MSGSGELMLLVLTTIREPKLALLYVGIFGLGMMTGMLLLTALFARMLGLVDVLARRGLPAFDRTLVGASGLASVGFGLYLMSGLIMNLS